MCIIIFSVHIYIIYTPVSTTCNTISIYKWLEKIRINYFLEYFYNK